MPKTIAGTPERITMPFNADLVHEIDRVVRDYPQYGWNRLTFAQEAVRAALVVSSPY